MTDPPFGTVVIIGVGLIGGSLGLALKERHAAQRVVGVGRDSSRLDLAARLGAIDFGTTDWTAAVSEADLIVLCTTIGHILSTLPDVLMVCKPEAVVTDVGSTKTAIAQQAGSSERFVAGHPMAGSEKGGVEAARADLFVNATWALTPYAHTAPDALQTVKQLAETVGAYTKIFTPEAHDTMVSVTSHLPHALASSLMRLAQLTARRFPATPNLAAGSFADMTRVAASSPELWRDVCLSNRSAVLQSLAGLKNELSVLEHAVDTSDAAAIEAFFKEGAAAKASWKSTI